MRKLVALAALFFFTACGFQALQSQDYKLGNKVNISEIAVETDSSRFGQLLKAELEDQANPSLQATPKLYRVKITIKENEVAVFINPDGTSSRGDIQFNTTYVLTRIVDGKQITKGTLQRVSSYNNSLNADYASYVSQQDARKRAVLALAQDYKLRLANLMASLNNPSATPLPASTVPSADVPPIVHSQYDNETYTTGH